MVRPASGCHRVLLERAQAGRGLARVEHGCPGALDRVDVPTGERGDPREPPEEVQRDALTGEDRPLRARDAGDDGRRCHRISVARQRVEADVRIEHAEHRLGDTEPADDPGLLHEQRRRADRLGRNRRIGRDVTGADVLRERRMDDALERVGRYCHGSSAGS